MFNKQLGYYLDLHGSVKWSPDFLKGKNKRFLKFCVRASVWKNLKKNLDFIICGKQYNCSFLLKFYFFQILVHCASIIIIILIYLAEICSRWNISKRIYVMLDGQVTSSHILYSVSHYRNWNFENSTLFWLYNWRYLLSARNIYYCFSLFFGEKNS